MKLLVLGDTAAIPGLPRLLDAAGGIFWVAFQDCDRVAVSGQQHGGGQPADPTTEYENVAHAQTRVDGRVWEQPKAEAAATVMATPSVTCQMERKEGCTGRPLSARWTWAGPTVGSADDALLPLELVTSERLDSIHTQSIQLQTCAAVRVLWTGSLRQMTGACTDAHQRVGQSEPGALNHPPPPAVHLDLAFEAAPSECDFFA